MQNCHSLKHFFQFVEILFTVFWGGLHLQGSARITTVENKSTKTLAAWGGKVADLSKQKVQKPLLNGLLLGLIGIGIQGVYVKLKHCQAVMIKQ